MKYCERCQAHTERYVSGKCKQCVSRYNKACGDWPDRKDKHAVRRLENVKENIKRYEAIYGKPYCADCKRVYNWVCYDFHHKKPTQKEREVRLYLKWETIKEEIKKCILLCANCHRLRHSSKAVVAVGTQP